MIPFTCPYCETEFEVAEDETRCICVKCGHRLDLDSQFAYLRGLEAFTEGQDLLQDVSPRQRRKPLNARDKQAMRLFMEAYTAIQVAFRQELADDQRALGIEMMSSMAGEFMKRNMVSAVEASYWNTLLVESNAHKEYDAIKQKLANLRGPLAFLVHLRLWVRQKQLLRGLAQIDAKLRTLEKVIEFTEVPRARDYRWKP